MHVCMHVCMYVYVCIECELLNTDRRYACMYACALYTRCLTLTYEIAFVKQ